MTKKWLIKKYKQKVKQLEHKLTKIEQERLVTLLDIEDLEQEGYNENTFYEK